MLPGASGRVSRRPGTAGVLARQVSAVGACIAAGDRQAQSGATTVGRPTMIKSHQPLEDPLPVGRHNTGTRVEGVDHRPALLSLLGNMHLPLRTRCAYGVVDHVAQDPTDLVGVPQSP